MKINTVEELVRKTLSHPYRVRFWENEDSLGFESSSGEIIYVERKDIDYGETQPFRTRFFLNIIESDSGKKDYVEGINYGKPVFKQE